MSDDQEDIEEVVDDVNDMSDTLIERQSAGLIRRFGGKLRAAIVLLVPLLVGAAVVWAHRAGRLLPEQQSRYVMAGVVVVLLVVYYMLLRSDEDESYTRGPGERFEV